MLVADGTLAARLESIGARAFARMADAAASLFPEFGPAAERVAGGIAVFLEPASLVNQASGCGLAGPVTDAEVRRLVEFFRSRGAQPCLSLAPFADPTLLASLRAAGFAPVAFENLLGRPLDGSETALEAVEDIVIREATSFEERRLWGILAADAFSAPYEPDDAQRRLGRTIAHTAQSTLLIAYIDEMPAGTAVLEIDDGVAWLSGDATLPRFRGRGVQRALQLHRLRLAAEAGCELAVSEALPGSGSQRNMHRVGFELLYTRVDVAAPMS